MNGEYSPCKQHMLNDGNSIPVVALGTSRILLSETVDVITTAADIGYRHFDTAEFYSNITQTGEGIRKVLLSGKVKRKDLFITAKVNILPEMEGAVKIGLTRSIGLSNFNQQQVESIIQKCTIPPAVLQTECHAHLQITDLVQFCQDKEIFVIAFAPLGSPGLSTLKSKFGSNFKHLTNVENSNQPCDIYHESIVRDLAKQHERTPAQILLRHHIQRGLGVLPKSSNPERLKENINIFDFNLTKCDMESMEMLEKGRRIFSFGL
ncbi:uncharacterized protein LOC127726815 [Mytilus californianus]|uniref:uncharacterized protein LOC127726815 n=1 Tax=Mytilus californianus TaxID=6549 RepID=UPI002246D074|nr:uncharacterized protein LOC127726815 [Mytilus californianus]